MRGRGGEGKKAWDVYISGGAFPSLYLSYDFDIRLYTVRRSELLFDKQKKRGTRESCHYPATLAANSVPPRRALPSRPPRAPSTGALDDAVLERG